MLLSTFMEYALEGYGAVIKEGILERMPSVSMKRTFSHKRKPKPTAEENIRTVIAFIEAVRKEHGSLCSHLATLLLVDTIKGKTPLYAELILNTYQTMLEIEEVLKQDYEYFSKLPLAEQKNYMLLMASAKVSLKERKYMSHAFLFQALFTPTTYYSERTQ